MEVAILSATKKKAFTLLEGGILETTKVQESVYMYNTPPNMLVYNSGARTQYLGCWRLRRRRFTVTKHPAPVFPLRSNISAKGQGREWHGPENAPTVTAIGTSS